MSRTGRLLWLLVTLLLAAAAVVAWIKVGPMLYPEAVLVASPETDCDLRQAPCVATFPDGTAVAFEISPGQIPVVEELKLSVRPQGINARQVQVDFSGVNMNMGFNRVELQPTESGGFTGTGMLPVCVRAHMIWEAKVLLHTDKGLMAAPFRFDTYLPGEEPPPTHGGR